MTEILVTDYLVLDTETTGLPAAGNEPLSITVIDQAGTVLLDTLVRPVHHTTWPGAQAIHGITPEQVLRPEVPTLADLLPQLVELLRGRVLVIYNADYDTGILAEPLRLGPPAAVHCCMLAFAEYYGDWNEWFGSFAYQNLTKAARHVLHHWTHPAHTALGDCLATRSVWQFLQSPERRLWVGEERERRQEAAEIRQAVNRYIEQSACPGRLRLDAVNEAWTTAFFRRLGPPYAGSSARDSADAFCRQLLGCSVHSWNKYGAALKLPRYGTGITRTLPPHLVADGSYPNRMHFLRPVWRPGGVSQAPGRKGKLLRPSAMWVSPGWSPDELELTPLYSIRKLVLGVDYVPYANEYPEGHYSASTLQKQFKLKRAQLTALRPGYFKSTQYLDYLLYAWSTPATDMATPAGGGGEELAITTPLINRL